MSVHLSRSWTVETNMEICSSQDGDRAGVTSWRDMIVRISHPSGLRDYGKEPKHVSHEDEELLFARHSQAFTCLQ